MTDHERQMVKTLCTQISAEKDPAVFTELTHELDALLEKLNNHQVKHTGFEGENTAT